MSSSSSSYFISYRYSKVGFTYPLTASICSSSGTDPFFNPVIISSSPSRSSAGTSIHPGPPGASCSVCTVGTAALVQSDLCFLIPDIRDNSAWIALGGRVDLAGDSVSESEAVGIRFLVMSWLTPGSRTKVVAYLEILVVFPRSRSVISVIRELPRPGIVEVLALVKTFLGKLRYGPVSTNLPFASATSG